ncbi:uncharacterized protein LOC118189449 [Stegodyphus dumicola]|uniref:uncharacterized protein LOC118189449 n=1 Tax=Stegodyphus dumicola TaxID=202533 RepID=UPI0015A84AB2|nr:uncharacterized protein LOC118189449 [Stegodyphus dumicola]
MKTVILAIAVVAFASVALGGVIKDYHHGLDDYGHSDLLLHGHGHVYGGHHHQVIYPVVKHVSVVKKVPVVKHVPVIKHVPVVKHVAVVKHVDVVKKVPVVKHVTVDLGHHYDDHGLDLHGHGHYSKLLSHY